MTNRIIYDTYIGPPVFGIITADDVLQSRVVFSEQIKNLIGFRTYQPKTEYEGQIFYEVGYFAEMLYQGSAEAHIMLNMPSDYVEQSSHEIRLFKDASKELVSMNIVDTLYDNALDKFDELDKKDSFFSDKKSIRKLGYNKEIAYLCNLYLRLAKDVLLKEEFIVKRSDAEVLSAIKEGMFSKSTVEKEIEHQLDEIDQLKSESRLPRNPSIDFINNLIFKIRRVEDIKISNVILETK